MCRTYVYIILWGKQKVHGFCVLILLKRIKIVETSSGSGERDDLWLLCVGSVVIE